MNSLAPVIRHPEPAIAATAAALVGVGATCAVAGALSGGAVLVAVGAVLAVPGLLVLVAFDWIDGMALLVAALAAPAPFAASGVRLAPAAAATAALVFAWLARTVIERRSVRLERRAARSIVFLFAAVCLSAAFAGDPATAAREVVNWALLLSLMIVAIDEFRRNPRRMHDLALVIAGVMAVGGAFATLQAVGVLPSAFRWGSAFSRATLGFGWPNELGMFMAIGLPFAAYAVGAARTVSGKMAAWAGLIAAIGGLAGSFSRGSWVAVTLATVALFARGERRFAFVVWGTVGLAAIVIDAVSGGALVGRFTSIDGQLAVGQRFALMLAGLLMLQANPLVGVGPGGFESGLAEFGPRIAILWDYVGSAHNLYIHMAAEMGLIGLAALLTLLGTCAVAAYRGAARDLGGLPATLRRAILWSFATVCVVGLFEWSFSHGVGQLIVLVGAMAVATAAEEAT